MIPPVLDPTNGLGEKTSALNIKKDHKLNLAQSLLFAMGLRPELLFAHIQEKRYSATKIGPGRKSLSKKEK